MTDSKKHLAQATVAMAEVKTEQQLIQWQDTWMNSADYLALAEDDARELEQVYQRKAGWFMGVGAG